MELLVKELSQDENFELFLQLISAPQELSDSVGSCSGGGGGGGGGGSGGGGECGSCQVPN